MISKEFINDVYDIYIDHNYEKQSYHSLPREEKFFLIKMYFLTHKDHLDELIHSLKNPKAVFEYFVSIEYPDKKFVFENDDYLDMEKEMIKFIDENFSCPRLIFNETFICFVSKKIDEIFDFFISEHERNSYATYKEEEWERTGGNPF